MTAARFRVVLFVWTITYVWWFSLPFDAWKEPAYVAAAAEHAGSGAILPQSDELAFAFLILAIVSVGGLFFFLRWARWLFVASTIANVACAPLAGVQVTGPLDTTLGYILSLLTGLLLAFSWWPSLRHHFASAAPGAEETLGNNDAPAPDEELLTVFETSDAALVPVIHSLLTTAGIEFSTTSEPLQDLIGGGRLGGHNPAVGPVRFLVRKSDELFARDVLDLNL